MLAVDLGNDVDTTGEFMVSLPGRIMELLAFGQIGLNVLRIQILYSFRDRIPASLIIEELVAKKIRKVSDFPAL